MASEFVRCIKNVKDINKLSDNVTEENDIISDVNGNIYIRKNVGYHKLYDGDGINVDDRLNEIVADIESVEKDLNKIDLTIYAKKSDLVEYLTSEDLTLYAKKSDLDTYTKKSDLTLYAKISDLDTYAKKSDLATYVQVTDLNDYAKKSEIPDLTDYAKKTDIPTPPDLTTYAKKSEIPNPPDLTPYAKKTDIPTVPSLTPYAKKSELNPLAIGDDFVSSGEATQEIIDNATTGIIYLTKMIGVNEQQSSNAGYLITLVRSSFKKQLWLPYNTTNHLTRFFDGTSWSDWEKQLSQRDFDNLQAQIDELKA